MTIWLIDETWHYQYFPIDEDTASFEGFEPLVELWRLKSAGRRPKWSDFDLMDLQDWWGWITIYEAVDGQPLEFDVRLWGTKIVEMVGYDNTGRRISVENRPNETADFVTITSNDIRFARHVADQNVIGFSYGPYKTEFKSWKTLHEVHLPLSGDGITNDKIMIVSKLFEASSPSEE